MNTCFLPLWSFQGARGADAPLQSERTSRQKTRTTCRTASFAVAGQRCCQPAPLFGQHCCAAGSAVLSAESLKTQQRERRVEVDVVLGEVWHRTDGCPSTGGVSRRTAAQQADRAPG